MIFVANITLLYASGGLAAGISTAATEYGIGLQDQDDKGFYAEIRSSLFNSVDIENVVRILPFKRALVNFSDNEVDCFWPMDIDLLNSLIGSDVELIQSISVFDSTQHLFSRNGEPAITNINEVNGKHIAISIGSNLQPKLEQAGADVSPVRPGDSKALLLDSKRVDAVAGWAPENLITWNSSGIKPPNYDKNFKLNSAGNSVVCHDTLETKAFIDALDAIIPVFKASDEYKSIAINYSVDEILVD